MSEVLSSAIKKIDLRKHIDEIQKIADEYESRSDKSGDGQLAVEMLQGVLRNECSALAKEMGLGGEDPLHFMLTNALLSVAWSTFCIRRATLDQSLQFEQTLEMIDLANSLDDVLDSVVTEAARYAEVSDR